MKQRELEYSNLLLNISNTILEYFKKYGINSVDTKKHVINSVDTKNKEQKYEKNNMDIEQEQEQEQEQFINADSSKVELINSQKEQSIIPLLIGGWLLYKILK